MEEDTADRMKPELHYCITVDTQTLEDKTVTVRDRDTMVQERVAIDQLTRYLSDKLLLS
ncbi:MAG: His/Gly/Thr/Pro-type tRNA ligase C-terminal domain-containing protein [Ignavibacteriales bacterium]|nr:His/Gly/Thr/Pro-type tRNA ligase C-terminal domain-containing protein [Ignavibacteriales bacterium]